MEFAAIAFMSSSTSFLSAARSLVHETHGQPPAATQLICRDPRTLPAGGATEVEIARQLSAFGEKMTGLEQYAVAAFAEAMEVVPKTIAENSGAHRSEPATIPSPEPHKPSAGLVLLECRCLPAPIGFSIATAASHTLRRRYM